MQIDNTIPEFEPIIVNNDVQPDITVDDNLTNDDIIIKDDTADTTKDTPNYAENADPVAVATYEQLVEEGIIDKNDDFDGTWDKVKDSISNLPQRVLNTLIAQAPDITKDTVRFLFSSPNITQEELFNFVKVNQEELQTANVSVDTMDDARSYLEKIYQERGIKPRQVEVMIAALEEDQVLIDEAKEELEKAELSKKDKPKTESLIVAKEEETARLAQARADFSNKVFEELNNTGWKASKIDEIKGRIVKNEISPLLTEIFKNPKALVKMVDFLGYFKNGDIDYDKFISNIDTPKGKDFKSKLESAINSPTLSTKSNLKNSTTNIPDDARPVLTFD